MFLDFHFLFFFNEFIIIKRTSWIENRISSDTNNILFSSLLSNFIEIKNIVMPRIEKTNVNPILFPSLILEWYTKYNKKTFIIIITSDSSQLNLGYSVNINPIKELINIAINPTAK